MLKARCVLRSASSSCAAARVAASRTPRSRVVASATQPIYHRANRQSTLATRHEPSPRFFSTFPPARTQTTPPTPTLTPLPEFPSVVLDDAPVADSERRYADPEAVFVVSGSGQGIGTAIVEQLLRRSVGTVVCLGRRPDQSAGLDALGAAFGADRVRRVPVDLSVPSTIDAAAAAVHTIGDGRVDMLLNVAGVLGDGKVDPGPERTARKLDAAWMRHTFDLNVFGHAQLTGALFGNGCLRVGRKKNRTRPAAVVGSLTARVGSIGDNRLGGWYSYRMSKAAMNQFTKTFALEASRDNCFPISLHPGTVDTDLSVPFQKGVPEGKLFTPEFSASRMLAVLERIDASRAGGFFDWKGDAIPW